MKTIKEKYHDALYFASSTMNLKEDFYITLGEKDILLKLIQYGKTKEKAKKTESILWTNKAISEHIFYKEDTVRKLIQRLTFKQYLNVEDFTKKINGEFVTRRKMLINWIKIEEVFNMIETHNNEEDVDDDTTPNVDVPVEKIILAPIEAIKSNEFVTLNNGIEENIPIELMDYWMTIKDKPKLITKLVDTNFSDIFLNNLKESYEQSSYKHLKLLPITL